MLPHAEPRRSQNLFIDADDTLWENNIYFEQVIEEFLDSFQNTRYSRAEMRAILDEIEHTHRSSRGYGVQSFSLNLLDACRRISETPPDEGMLRWVAGLSQRIVDHPLDLIDGVRETLECLASRNLLILLTKGDVDEQDRKIRSSGLRDYFSATEIVREKNRSTYRLMLESHALDPSVTWMVGNSPRSDINPAMAAGWNAVFVPHHRTWMLEREELAAGPGKLIVLEKFGQLPAYF